MKLTSVVLQVAGFVLAHGANSATELDEDERLIPFGMAVVKGNQNLIRIDSGSETEEIANCKNKLESQKLLSEACAVIYQSTKTSKSGDSSYIYNVAAWERGMDVDFRLVQIFQPSAKGEMIKIVGEPLLFVNDEIVTDQSAMPLLGFVFSGLTQHPGGKLWDEWNSKT